MDDVESNWMQDVESQYKTAEGFWKGEIDHLKNQMFDVSSERDSLIESMTCVRSGTSILTRRASCRGRRPCLRCLLLPPHESQRVMLVQAKVGEMDKEMMQLRKLLSGEQTSHDMHRYPARRRAT